MKLAVVGAGVAGTAAAWLAARRGADVTVVHSTAGASALYCGALDVGPWESRAVHAVDATVLSFATAFEAWALGAAGVRVVTDAGVVRPARGLDVGLLDLEPLAGGRVAVADVPALGWDGEALTRAAAASRWARDTGTRFFTVGIDTPDPALPIGAPHYDVAASLDVEASAIAFADHLRKRNDECEAWLVGPWLGTRVGVAELVRERLGRPCGETTSPPGGPAGARFESARDQMLESLGVRTRLGRVRRVHLARGAWWLVVDEAAELGPFDAVVLAVGGLVGEGIVLSAPSHGSPGRFRLSLDAPVELELGGHLTDSASTLYGVDVQVAGRAVLEEIGVRAEGGRVPGARGLLVAGDVVAGKPRTVLAAVASALSATRATLA